MLKSNEPFQTTFLTTYSGSDCFFSYNLIDHERPQPGHKQMFKKICFTFNSEDHEHEIQKSRFTWNVNL